MRPTTRDRLLLPILLPVAILAAVAAALWGFSRILLSVTSDAATATALVVAASIMAVAAVAAARPRVLGSTVAAMAVATAGIAMLAGGIALAVAGGGGEEGGPGPGPGPGPAVELVAQNIAFDPTSLSVPAGRPFTIAFDNKDAGVQHDVQIFATKDFSGTPLFDGELVTGPATSSYRVDALDPGTYYFRCVVHPTMTGQIDAAGGGGAGGGGGVTITAKNIAFDTDRIALPAGAPTTITFDNEDAGVQHDISIYRDSSLTDRLFQGDLVTGPNTATYRIPPIPAGEYYFQCDVHPTMNGAVVVGGEGGGSSGPSGASGAATGPSG